MKSLSLAAQPRQAQRQPRLNLRTANPFGALASLFTRTPLLRYPLTLGPARRVRLRPAVRTRTAPGAVLSEGLLGVLGGPSASPCIQVDGVLVVAGRPAEQDLVDQWVQGG